MKINKKGLPFDVKVLKGDSDLAEAALAAVKNWRFKPYKLNGSPAESNQRSLSASTPINNLEIERKVPRLRSG